MADARAVAGDFWRNRTDVFVAFGVIAVVMMMIIPLPAVLLDVLMAVNLVLSLLVILTVLYTRHALEFSVFPTLLLVTTVFGLALNVSSTRLILSQGSQFNGRIVRAFGTFVVGSRGVEGYVIGFIIFIIIIAVQFIVITKGATRVAEVAARFTLDALPGQADGHRSRVQLGAHHRGGGHPAEERPAARGGLLRRDGRRLEVHLGQRQGRHPHHGREHHRRHGGRHDHPRRELADRHRHVRLAHHRRRPRHAAAGAPDLHGHGHHRHARRLGQLVRQGHHQAVHRAVPALPHRRRLPGGALLPARLPLVRADPDGRPRRGARFLPGPAQGGGGGEGEGPGDRRP